MVRSVTPLAAIDNVPLYTPADGPADRSTPIQSAPTSFSATAYSFVNERPFWSVPPKLKTVTAAAGICGATSGVAGSPGKAAQRSEAVAVTLLSATPFAKTPT